MTFVLNRTVDLSPFGWADCSVTLKSISMNEVKQLQTEFEGVDETDPKMQDAMFKFLEDKFVSGDGLNEKGEKIPIKPTDVPDLPLQIVQAIRDNLIGITPSPN